MQKQIQPTGWRGLFGKSTQQKSYIKEMKDVSVYDETLLEQELETENDLEDEMEDELCICDGCGCEMVEEEATFFDENLLCESCLDDRTTTCQYCGRRIWNDCNYGDEDTIICSECDDLYYTRCDDCERLIRNEDACYHDSDEYNDAPYCESCFEKHKEKHIHSYYYKPDPIFYRNDDTARVYGVELEIDGGGESQENAGKLLEIANDEDEYLYCKHDGSLNNGFEMVSHPMALNYHINVMPWRKVLAKALHMGYKSHDSGTCGLHIHVGRNELGAYYETQEEVIARILFFIERHWDKMLRFSRRTENQINQWAARYGCKENAKETLKHAKGTYARYVSLNLQNSNTIEFRIFRGSLKYGTFIAALQLVDAICGAAVAMQDEEFESMTWNGFLSTINPTTKPELVAYLQERRIYEPETLEQYQPQPIEGEN